MRNIFPNTRDLRSILYFLLMLIIIMSVFSEPVLTQEIMAIVGDEPILLTEVEMAVMMEQGELPEDDGQYDILMRRKLDEIIDEKLLYEAAVRESLVVDDEYLNQAFDERWEEMKKGFATEELFKDALGQEGYTVPEFKRQMRVKLREALTKQRFIQSLVGRVDVTPDYIDNFYREYKDSLPEKPAMVRLSVIVLQPDMQEAMGGLLSIANQVADGLDSETDMIEKGKTVEKENPYLDVTYGNLGSFSPGDLHPALDSVAQNLQIGDVSRPVISPGGIHIIKRVDGKDISLHHITISGEIKGDNEGFRQMSEGIYKRLIAHPDSFQTFIELYSQEEQTEDGDLGYFEIEKMDPELSGKIKGRAEGDILAPIFEKNEVDIFRITELHEKGPVTPETDYQTLEELARQHRISEIVKAHLDRIRQEVFIDIRIDN